MVPGESWFTGICVEGELELPQPRERDGFRVQGIA